MHDSSGTAGKYSARSFAVHRRRPRQQKSGSAVSGSSTSTERERRDAMNAC